jgi:hypothetical protein
VDLRLESLQFGLRQANSTDDLIPGLFDRPMQVSASTSLVVRRASLAEATTSQGVASAVAAWAVRSGMASVGGGISDGSGAGNAQGTPGRC